MGEGFRRQLLMDGQMGNLVFIATQVWAGCDSILHSRLCKCCLAVRAAR